MGKRLNDDTSISRDTCMEDVLSAIDEINLDTLADRVSALSEKFDYREEDVIKVVQKRKLWIEAIRSYAKGEMTDSGNDDDIAFHEEFDIDYGYSRSNEQLLNIVRHNGKYEIPDLGCWGGGDFQDWMTEKTKEVSSEAFYLEFLDERKQSYFGWEPDDNIKITDNQDGKGKSLHVDLGNMIFDYSDETEKTIITLKERYRKYYKDNKPIVICCDSSKNIGLNINRVFWLSSDTTIDIDSEMYALKMRVSKYIVSELGYLYDTVRPLLSSKRGIEIGYFDHIDIQIKKSYVITISLILSRYVDEKVYEQKNDFNLKNNFKTEFRKWWCDALINQIKWLNGTL